MKLGMLPQPVGVLKLLQDLFCISNIQEETCADVIL